jgi:hypothetical protein
MTISQDLPGDTCTVWCLPTCMVYLSTYVCWLYYVFLPVQNSVCSLNDVCLPVWCLLTCIMSAYLYSVCYTACLPTSMTSAFLYYVCLLVLCLPILYLLICVMTAQLNDVCLSVWRLPTCSMSVWLPVPANDILHNCMIPASLYDAWLLCQCCLAPCIMSGYLYDVCLALVCLPTSIMQAQRYDVCLPYDFCLRVLCLPTSIMSAQLYNVCLHILCLATSTLDVCLPLRNDVLLPVCLPTCMLSAFLYDVC